MDFVYNDGGRQAAGFKGAADDCVVRAIAIATGKPYRVVYDELNARSKKERTRKGSPSSSRTGVRRKVYEPYLKELGWQWTPCMQVGQGCKTHLRSDELPKGNLIVAVSKHMTAVLNGVMHDTHDCARGGTRCVYGYYYLPVCSSAINWRKNETN
jgi:hypothetical protein